MKSPNGDIVNFDSVHYRMKTLLGRKIDALAKDVVELYTAKIAEGYKSNNIWPVSERKS